MTEDVNKNYRVHSGDQFKGKGVIRMVWYCLVTFPFLWVSIVRVFICGRCLMIFDITQLQVCECQALLTLVKSTEQTMWCSAL